MRTITGTDKYSSQFIGMTVLLVCVLGVTCWWKHDAVWPYIGIFIFFECAFLAFKFTYAIHINNAAITICYYRWGIKKSKTFLLAGCEMKIKDEVTKSGRKYPVLKISINNKTVYTIDAQSGFDRNDFEAIISENVAVKHAAPTQPALQSK